MTIANVTEIEGEQRDEWMKKKNPRFSDQESDYDIHN